MKLVAKSFGPPPGHYNATFEKVEDFNQSQFGPSVKLTWVITDGDWKNQEASRICTASLSAQSILGKFVVAMGGHLTPGETVDLDSFVGTRGTIFVEPTEKGSKVASFAKTSDRKSSPQPQAEAVSVTDDEIPY